MKKIHLLKKEKEALAVNYEQEEEFLTNDLSRKLTQVSHKSEIHCANIVMFVFLVTSGKSQAGANT